MSIDSRRASGADGLFIVGLVGRTGSGKSTVARALAEDGAELIEGDALGHDVTDHDPDVRAALIEEYGGEVYRADGALDRARVAERVFRDPEARARLDRLVHPRILQRIQRRLAELRARGFRGVVAIDAALLLEWGLERECDAVIAVIATETEQIARLVRARGWTEKEARRRLGVQRTDEAFARDADVTIENHGDEATLRRTARHAIAGLRARRAASPPRTRTDAC